MKSKFWEDIVNKIHEENSDQKNNLGQDPDYKMNFQRATGIKKQLKKVFLWDLFNKEEAKLRVDYRLQIVNKSAQRLYNRIWFRAAVFVIAIISGVIGHSLYDRISSAKLYTEISVPLGQMTQVKLSDGSKVWLNSGSVFKYPNVFEQSSRDIYLDGEAFLEVAKNSKKPFIIKTNNFSVKVLGTSFNVDAYSNDRNASVTLIEGAVLLQSNKKDWKRTIIPGQVASIDNGQILSVSETKTEFYTAWTEGKIIFRKETLEEIAKKMERWYNIEIFFADEELKKLRFSGTFLKYKPVEQVFKSFSIMDDRVDFVLEDRINNKNIIKIMKR